MFSLHEFTSFLSRGVCVGISEVKANRIQKFPKQTPRLRNEVNKCREIICMHGLVFIHTINWEGVSFSYRWATEWTTETRNKVPFSCPCVEKSHFPALCRKTANFHFYVVHESSSKVRKGWYWRGAISHRDVGTCLVEFCCLLHIVIPQESSYY